MKGSRSYRRRPLPAIALALLTAAPGMTAGKTVDWRHYGGDPAGTRYTTLTQIKPSNVARLKVAWRYDIDTRSGIQNQPIVVAGVLYAVAGGKAFALDAATGKEKWVYAPPNPGGFLGAIRGLSWWTDGKERRLFISGGTLIYCLDPATGQPITGFGDGGKIDLRAQLRGAPEDNYVHQGSPANVYRDMLITAGGVSEEAPASPGDIRAWDVRTGALRWTFHTIPHPGEEGYETWPKDAYLRFGGVNNWQGNVVDDKRGIVYVSTGSPADDFWGGERPGDNLFSDSMIALDANTGKKLWHYQTIHHDLWDDDFSAPPVLMTVSHNGRMVDAVAATNKTGFIYLFDRVTGEPLWPIDEVPTPQNAIEGDKAAPTQPKPRYPEPLTRRTVTADALTNRTPEANAWARAKFATMVAGDPLTPPQKDRETIIAPGMGGGAEWGGMTFDPKLQYMYVNTNNIAWSTAVVDRKPPAPGAPAPRGQRSRFGFSGYNKFYDPDGYPAVAPPWGHLTAIDMRTGKFAWRIPFGEYPELAERGMTNTGTESYGGGIATASGLFLIGATTFDRKFHAYDSRTGRLVWETVLPYAGNATPATYMVDGKQFVAILTSGQRATKGPKGSALVVFALDDGK